MPLDRLMPHCDVFERHSTFVRASPERVYAAIRTADLAGHPVTKTLIAMRGLGRNAKSHKLEEFLARGFTVLAEDPPREIVIGVQGPFWKPACKLHDIDEQSFLAPVPNGAARAAWNFLVEHSGDGSRLTTETRVLCADDARISFRLYWLIVRPFSGLIRRLMLRAIRSEAER